MKLIVEEAESAALRSFLSDYPRRFSSRIAAIEVGRAAANEPEVADASLSEVFARLEMIELTPRIAARATGIKPAGLRTLDAIHLASAATVSGEIQAFVTYDARLGQAAGTLGMTVVTPGS